MRIRGWITCAALLVAMLSGAGYWYVNAATTNTRVMQVEDLAYNQGDILYFTGTLWTRLAPGTSGHYLQTQGAAANPQWAASSGGGTVYPIRPYTAVPVTSGTTFPWTYDTGAGTGRRHTHGMGVAASLVADADWALAFQMPLTLPGGCTHKLRLKAQANAATGNAQVDVLWGSVATEEDPSAITHTSEGVTQVAWGASDNHQYKVTDIVLDADTVVGGEEISMILRFESTSWTLAQVSAWNAFIICN